MVTSDWQQQVRNTHLHAGEFHGSELMLANFMQTYHDPSFLEAHRTMTKVTPSAIVEWLKRRGTFKMPSVAKPWTLRRWIRRMVSSPAQFLPDLPKLRPHTVAPGLPLKLEDSSACAAADKRKAQSPEN
jgi:hypothetical protein